ncbi:hypothetical protein FB451DRAFT_355419 [Mycena latifolia]|nr:hypothetical protein FB451DRAFT_355419 [Mycena latifolia]
MPHPSLDFGNLAKLPANLRKLALSAQAPASDSEDAISQIRAYVLEGEDNPVSPTAFLPVIYHLLKPPEHPLPEDQPLLSDAELELYLPFLARVLTAMEMLETLAKHSQVQRKVVPDLWQRLWPYLQFQNRYITQLADDEIAIATLHLSLIRHLAFPNNNRHPQSDIDQTFGIRRVIMRIWSRCYASLGAAADDLGDLLQDFMGVRMQDASQVLQGRSPHFPEILDGAGGTLHDLASLAVKHVNAVAADVQTYPDGIKGRIQGMTFWIELIAVDGALDLAVFNTHGLLRALTECIIALRQASFDHTELLIKSAYFKALYVIPRMARVSPGLPYVVEALDEGLLFVVVQCGMWGLAKGHPLVRPLTDILRVVLCGQLAVHSVLRRVERSLKRIDTFDLTHMRDNELWPAWSQFNLLARARLKIKARFDAKNISKRFCDNIPCSRIAQKRTFRSCAQCATRYYCSPACQAVDWTTGGHQKVCRTLRGTPRDEDLSRKDNAFLRHLVHHDYQAQKRHIMMLQLEFMQNSETEPQPLYTEFDYIEGEAKFAIYSTQRLPALLPSDTARAQWADHCARLARDPGKMQLHVALTEAGYRPRYSIFPLRSDSTALHDGLAELIEQWDILSISERTESSRSLEGRIQIQGVTELH